MTNQSHLYPLRIYYEDTDAGGIVYHANYLRFMERARTELLRDLGLLQNHLAHVDRDFFVVGEVQMRFIAPAKLDDALTVHTHVTRFGNASLAIQQNIFKRVDQTDQLLVKGTVTLVYINHAGKAVRLPDNLRAALHPYLHSDES